MKGGVLSGLDKRRKLKTGKEIANTGIQGINELPGKSQPLGTTATVTQTLTCTFFTSGEEKGETNTSNWVCLWLFVLGTDVPVAGSGGLNKLHRLTVM